MLPLGCKVQTEDLCLSLPTYQCLEDEIHQHPSPEIFQLKFFLHLYVLATEAVQVYLRKSTSQCLNFIHVHKALQKTDLEHSTYKA